MDISLGDSFSGFGGHFVSVETALHRIHSPGFSKNSTHLRCAHFSACRRMCSGRFLDTDYPPLSPGGEMSCKVMHLVARLCLSI